MPTDSRQATTRRTTPMDNHDTASKARASGTRAVLCPRCGKEVEWSVAFPFRPFCSERCKLIDLGQWASEQYRIPAEPQPEGGEVPDDEERR